MEPLEPIAATAAAFRLLGGTQGEVERDFRALAAHVQDAVPDVVVVSLSFRDPAVTFTVTATDIEWRSLDGAQYLEDGPCEAAVREDRIVELADIGALSEEQWSLFARASAHLGVGSSLSVPVHLAGEVVGSLNVYAATTDAFEGRVPQVAELVQSPAALAVRDADLGFSSRLRAEASFRSLAEQRMVDLAAGILAAREGIAVEDAVVRLQVSAARAGVPTEELAKLVVELHMGG